MACATLALGQLTPVTILAAGVLALTTPYPAQVVLTRLAIGDLSGARRAIDRHWGSERNRSEAVVKLQHAQRRRRAHAQLLAVVQAATEQEQQRRGAERPRGGSASSPLEKWGLMRKHVKAHSSENSADDAMYEYLQRALRGARKSDEVCIASSAEGTAVAERWLSAGHCTVPASYQPLTGLLPASYQPVRSCMLRGAHRTLSTHCAGRRAAVRAWWSCRWSCKAR